MPQSNQCILCIHFWGNKSCDAFPDGIPEAVITGEIEHTKPLPKQGNDIVFKRKPKDFIRMPEGM